MRTRSGSSLLRAYSDGMGTSSELNFELKSQLWGRREKCIIFN